MTELLRLRARLKRPDGFTASFDLTTPLAGVTAILGRSGAGKSTLLRMIAGLEPTAQLALSVADEVWDDAHGHRPAHQRSVSVVFQDGRLFPHLDVAANLRFPLRRRARPGFSLPFEVVVDSLALNELLARMPHTLSGGQRQRVALGRALLTPARLWLFDEPLAALDTHARNEIAPYLERICREHRVPIFYVTHSLEDVAGVADTVLTIADGQITSNRSIEALDSALPIDGTSRGGSVLRCRVAHYDAHYDLTELKLGNSSLYLRGQVPAGWTDVRVLVPARDVSLATQAVTGLSVLNQLPSSIETLHEAADGTCSVTLQCEGQRLLSQITRYSRDHLALQAGQHVTALIKTVALATLH